MEAEVSISPDKKPSRYAGKDGEEVEDHSDGAEAAARNEGQLNKLCIARPSDIKPASGIVFDGH